KYELSSSDSCIDRCLRAAHKRTSLRRGKSAAFSPEEFGPCLDFQAHSTSRSFVPLDRRILSERCNRLSFLKSRGRSTCNQRGPVPVNPFERIAAQSIHEKRGRPRPEVDRSW